MRWARLLAAALVACGVAALIERTVRIGGFGDTPLTQVTSMVRAVAAALFLAAGVLRVARWRLTSEPRCGIMGAALLVLGGLTLPLTAVVRALTDERSDNVLALAVRASATAAVMLLICRALAPPHSPLRRWLDRRTTVLLALWTIGAACASLVGTRGLAAAEIRPASLAVGTALATAWTCLAAAAGLRGRTQPWAAAVSPLLGGMAIAELVRMPNSPGTTLSALLVTVSVAGFAARAALDDLGEANLREHRQALELASALVSARTEVTRRDEWREELTHDARNALAGIHAAVATLQTYGERLDAATAGGLAGAALGELVHLEQLLLSTGQVDPVDFEVGQALRPVVDNRRAAGLLVTLEMPEGLRARGVPADLARVVGNLLANVEVHAPGAPVSVHCRRTERRVEIEVADDGPGLTPQEAEQAFDRGARGDHSTGSGLGLAVARTLMHRQGGDIVLTSYRRGARFLLTLPTPVASPAAPRVPEQRGAATSARVGRRRVETLA